MRVSVVNALQIAALAVILLLSPDMAQARPAQRELGTEGDGTKIVVNIDKGTQRMTVAVNGVQTYTWPVSTGMRGYSTPSGNFTATSMNEIWYSKEWDNAAMPHSVFFLRDGHAIHATYDVKNLGKPASHGCVRLSPQNAATLFDLVKKSGLQNTQVIVSGSDPSGNRLSSRNEPEKPAGRPARQAAPPPARQVVRQPAPPSQDLFLPRIFGF